MRNIGKCIGMVLLSVAVVACGGQNKRNDRTVTATGTETKHEVREMAREAKTTALDSLRKDPNYGKVVESRYTGKLPAADGPGIDYDLRIWHQERSEDGVYTLSQTYLEADRGNDVTYVSDGRFTARMGSGQNRNAKVLVLTPFTSSKGDVMRFVVQGNKWDSITMLNANGERSKTNLNYTLVKR